LQQGLRGHAGFGGPAAAQVVAERVDQCGAPFRGADQLLDAWGAGVLLDGVQGEVEPAGDLVVRHALAQQGVDGRIPAAGAPHRGTFVAALARGDVAETATVGQGEFLDSVAQVLEQMPAIGALHRLRRADASAGRVRGRAVPADELDSGMLLQPVGEGDAEPIGQHIQAAMGDGIDDDGGIPLTPFDREVVDADRRRDGRRLLRQCHQGAQHAGTAEQEPGQWPGERLRLARPAPARTRSPAPSRPACDARSGRPDPAPAR
jgi:hypothetical protein